MDSHWLYWSVHHNDDNDSGGDDDDDWNDWNIWTHTDDIGQFIMMMTMIVAMMIMTIGMIQIYGLTLYWSVDYEDA